MDEFRWFKFIHLGWSLDSSEFESPVKLVVRIIQYLGEINICHSQPLAIILKDNMNMETNFSCLQVLKEGCVYCNLNQEKNQIFYISNVSRKTTHES